MPVPATLAVDFGTSNSAAALLDEGALRRIALEPGAETLPTAVFFPEEGGAMRIGSAAAEALIAGEDGRYMRALKSVLGTPLFHEKRLIAKRRRTLAEIVTAFLVEVKTRAEAQTGRAFDRVLSGRPVHFHSSDTARDAAALADLRGCYEAAGFAEVDFLYEPEAAARACQEADRPGELGLVVDIGGGTSDFSVFRAAPEGIEILASHGIRLGGTDFDRSVSLSHAMPLLGLGSQLRRPLGEGLLPVPNALYVDLATWAMIPFLYTAETLRAARDMMRHAVEPEKFARLVSVLENELGHELAFAVERGKIAANSGAAAAAIDMGVIERGLAAPLTAGALAAALAEAGEQLRHAMYETLYRAQVSPAQIGAVVLVGGSSLMRLVADEARAVCPGARLRRSEAFTAVIDGLALATA